MIKKLDSSFEGKGEVSGFTYSKVKEGLGFYIYSVKPKGLKSKEFVELFKKKNVKVCIDFKNRIFSEEDFKEVYPKSKDFGSWAWTFPNIEKALQFAEKRGLID